MKKFTKIIITILTLLAVVALAFALANSFSEEKKEENIIDSFVGDRTDEAMMSAIHEYFKDGPSDIKGMTKSEKVNAGLNPADGSDSDYDGLTDKEEIEQYSSDPLKASTAGDLYTDGYKVAHNMDLHTKYDYEGDSSFSINGFTFTAVSPFDFDAKISNGTKEISKYKKYEADRDIDYDDVYEVYMINNYSNNTFVVNLNDVFVNNTPIDGEKITLKIFENFDKEPISGVDIKEDDNTFTVTLPQNMFPMSTYTVFICKDKGVIGGFLSSFNDVVSGTTDSTSEDASESENARYQSLITHWPFMCFIFNVYPKIYITDTATEQQIADTVRMANACYKESNPFFVKKGYEKVFTKEDCKVVSKRYIKEKTDFLESVFGRRYMYMGLMSDRMFFSGCYSPLDQYTDMYAAEREEKKELAKEFSGNDRFCFSNFNTNYYTDGHGVCSGYAWLVSMIHDHDGLNSLSGSYYSPYYDTEVSYDMDANDPDNLTLLDRYVGDYKAYKFKILAIGDKAFNGPLTDDEKEFTKMVSAYWAQFNDAISQGDVALRGFISNKSMNFLSWQTVENMKKSLDDNKILEWSFNIDDKYGSAHTVNLISYDTYDCDGTNDTVLFDVYDSNYPNDTLTLKCKKIISSRGDESFTYEFSAKQYGSEFSFKETPTEKGPYDAYTKGDTVHTFFVLDSDLNCLNVPLEL